MKTNYMHTNLAARWLHPIQSLSEHWAIKSISAALLALIAAELELVILVAVLMILDFLTGLIAARRRKQPIQSWGMRQTVVKSIEYAVFLLMCVMISNAFEIMGWLDTSAFLYVALTELKSILENITHKDSGLYKVYLMLMRDMKEKINSKFDPNIREKPAEEN